MRRWTIRVTATAFGQIKSAPSDVKQALQAKVESLKNNPALGKPLSGPLQGHRRLTVSGRWRLIYQTVTATNSVTLKAFGMRKAGAKKDIYELAQKLLRQGLLLFLGAAVLPALVGCAGRAWKKPDKPIPFVLTPIKAPSIKLPYASPLKFMPMFETFRADPGTDWGPDKVLGGLWRKTFSFEAKLLGAAFDGEGGALVVERPAGYFGTVLSRLDRFGREVSSGPFEGSVSDIEAGALGGRRPLLVSSPYSLKAIDPETQEVWGPDGPVDEFRLADLDGDGANELLVRFTGYKGELAAYAGDGKRLWLKTGLGHTEGLAAGRLAGEAADSVVLFASEKGVTEISLLDGSGRVIASTTGAPSMPNIGVLADLDGSGPRLVTAGSGFQARRGLLKIWEIGRGGIRGLAETDLGWTNPGKIAAADLDGDGKKEIVLGTDNGWILVFSPEGKFLAERHYFGKINTLKAGDFEGDGSQEILAGFDGLPPALYAIGVTADPLPRPKRALPAAEPAPAR